MDVVRGNDKEVAGFAAASRGRGISLCQWILTAHLLGVRLSGGALEMSDEQLASQIVGLNTLAYLRWQLRTGVRVAPHRYSTNTDEHPDRRLSGTPWRFCEDDR